MPHTIEYIDECLSQLVVNGNVGTVQEAGEALPRELARRQIDGCQFDRAVEKRDQDLVDIAA